MNLITTFIPFLLSIPKTKLNLWNIPLQKYSFDLESNSQTIISPAPSLELQEVPEKDTVSLSPAPPSSLDLDLQANLSSPVTIIVSTPPTNSSSQALVTVAATQATYPEHDAHTMWLQYLLFVGGVCYAAVSATLQVLQGTRPLSIASKIVYAALLVSFTVFVLSVYIRTTYPRASAMAVHVGSLFGFAAFFVALFSSLTRRH